MDSFVSVGAAWRFRSRGRCPGALLIKLSRVERPPASLPRQAVEDVGVDLRDEAGSQVSRDAYTAKEAYFKYCRELSGGSSVPVQSLYVSAEYVFRIRECSPFLRLVALCKHARLSHVLLSDYPSADLVHKHVKRWCEDLDSVNKAAINMRMRRQRQREAQPLGGVGQAKSASVMILYLKASSHLKALADLPQP